MKTEHELAKILKHMMASQPLESISVVEMTKKCGVSRKTFYYHYHDTYDLLTQVFLDEKIPNIANANNFNELITIVWNYYKSNEAFINATLASAGKDLFEEFIFNAFYTTTIKFINKLDVEKVLPNTSKRSIARFYAFGYSNSFVYYLSNHKNKSLDGLMECFSFLGTNSFEKNIIFAIKGQKK